MGRPGGGPPGYRATWYPNRPVSGSGNDLGLVDQNLSLGAPIWKDGEDMLLFTAGVRHSLFFTDVRLPDSQRPFPEQLWNVRFGLMVLHTFDNGWSGGMSTSLGSASDRPFHSIEELNLGLFGFLKKPARNGRDWWTFSLMYSPVSNIVFPIPGVAYAWNPTESFQMNVGIPFSLRWSPAEDLTINLSYIPVINVSARVTYGFAENWTVYGGFEWLNEAYFLADRLNRSDRFVGIEKRIVGGVQWEPRPHLVLDLNGGYAFDRYYGEGQSQLSDLHDRVDVAPGAFVGASILARW